MVEWKELIEVCKIERGVRVIKKDLQDVGEIPVYQNSLTPLGYYSFSNYPANTPFVISAGAAGEIGFCSIPFWAADDCLCITSSKELSSKYVYYYLLVKQPLLKSRVRKASVPRLSRIEVEKIQIPIPSLSEQARIVGILDTFTSAIDNLKEQITQRRKQYEHYRDQLLDLEGKDGVEMKTLGEVCLKSKNIKWKLEPFEKTYKYIDLSSVNVDLHKIVEVIEINKEEAPSRAQQIVITDDVLLGTTRPTMKRYCQISSQYNNQICSTGYCIFRANTNIVLSRWIFYNIGNGRFWDYCEIKQQGAGYPCLSNSDAFAYSIPIPSLSEQQRIVSILDQFEASIQNLEAQLKEREKQYEYYRNKLLTF